MTVGLVIFYCDGVLIDSELIANRVFAAQLAGAGLHMPVEDVMRHFVGRTRQGCLDYATELLGGPLPQDFGPRWDAALHEALEREVRAIDGVVDVLRALRIPYCVASNGNPERMRLALRVAGVLPFLDGRMFTAADVARPKPAPDLFLHAARVMGAAPADCVVVEDTPTGVRAAVAAGMRVLAYAAAPHADRAALAAAGGRIFDDMRSLPGLLQELSP